MRHSKLTLIVLLLVFSASIGCRQNSVDQTTGSGETIPLPSGQVSEQGETSGSDLADLSSAETQSVSNTDAVVWLMGMDYEYDSDFQEAFNRLLKEKGCPQSVEFISSSDFQPDLSGVDIWTLPSDMGNTNVYSESVRAGLLEQLDEYLLKKDEKIRASYPEIVWESMKAEDGIFGLLSPLLFQKKYVIVNDVVVDECKILIDQDPSFEFWLDASEEVAGRKGTEDFIPFLVSRRSYIPGYESLFSMDGILIGKQNGNLSAYSYLQVPEYMEYLKSLNQKYLHHVVTGYVLDTKGITDGNFFAVMQSGSSKEQAVSLLRSTYQIPESISLSAYELPDWQIPFQGVGGKTSMLAASDKLDAAWQVLSAVYSDQELSEALVYGIRGQNFDVTEDGKIEKSENGLPSFLENFVGNSLLVRSQAVSDQEKQQGESEILQNPSMLLGFYPDFSAVRKEADQLYEVFSSHRWFLYGESDDFEAEAAALEQEYQQAGLDRVLEELDRQLKEWQDEK